MFARNVIKRAVGANGINAFLRFVDNQQVKFKIFDPLEFIVSPPK